MKSLICIAPGQFEYRDKEQPQPAPGQALIRIRRIGVCGTDLHAFEGTQPFFTYPRILGHELAGELVDTGGAVGFEKGETVSFIPYFNCGTCIACRNGKPNCCTNIKVCGVHVDGGMVEYLAVPADKLLHGEELGFDALALVEPLAIGAHGLRRAGVEAGEFVLVVGAGPIGLGIIALANIAGAQVIALDVNEHRLSFCRNKLGVQYTINGAQEDVVARLQAITNGDMPTVVVDATGNGKAINNAFQYMAHGARYVLVGLQKGDISFPHPEFHKREATLMSSRNATREDFEHVIRCIRNQQIDPLTFITHTVPFKATKDQFAGWLDPANGVIKAMVAID
ncbi:zinc-binding alcohol dehydrogenase family protein [Paraflavitalea pollutisoli]|uniref:zinc-binding alcohol dehydrogenase family protein n=1 Tax=Paraflavitalea pollutisoli TaxID=3034143 RepID=UPI0023ED7793|nr:zinc-binding alcohol dehydrogenase family protein [Paraflavitalea sp. H1-2-19X]